MDGRRAGQATQVGPGVWVYPEQSKSTAVFVLGLVGFLVFPLAAPFAWALGSREIAAIKAGRRPPDGRALARIGQVLGIIVTVVLILFVLLVIGLVAISL